MVSIRHPVPFDIFELYEYIFISMVTISMNTHIHHHQLRDLRFLGMLLLTLVLIAGFVAGQRDAMLGEGSAWRRIDLQALQERIESGDLSDHEALWYHPSSAGPEQ